jgi:ElaB/YqjD/DUF883 family membrane-anchored ribosome-binding protein
MNANEAMEQTAQKAKQSVESLKDTMKQAKSSASDLSRRAAGKARDAGAAADLYVHEYAWTSLAIVAVAVGLLGYVLGRQRN